MKSKNKINMLANQVMQLSKDQGMVRNPDSWPQWPYLPMKHRRDTVRGGFPQLGTMYASEPLSVFVGPMYESLTGVPKTTYESIEDLLKDWMVD